MTSATLVCYVHIFKKNQYVYYLLCMETSMWPLEYSSSFYFYPFTLAEVQRLENPSIGGSGVDLEPLSCGLDWIYVLAIGHVYYII